MTRRLMFVHAHPDDESSKGAATAARYLDEGAEVVLVTCTGGEAGDVLNPNVAPIPAEEIAGVRQRELAEAVAAIGFTRTYQLGYHDSGYHEDPESIPTGTFARTPPEAPAEALADIIRRERPHVIVTYPEDGGYPHPDHIMSHVVTMRAVALAGDADAEIAETAEITESAAGQDANQAPWRVPKVYATTAFPAERVMILHQVLLDRGLDSPFGSWLERRERLNSVAMDADPDARIEVGEWFPRRDAALRAHATQVDPEGSWFQVPRDLEREFYPYEAYLAIQSDVPLQRPETDLFAGIDVDEADRQGGYANSERH